MLADEVEDERVVLDPNGPREDWTDMDRPAAAADAAAAPAPPPRRWREDWRDQRYNRIQGLFFVELYC